MNDKLERMSKEVVMFYFKSVQCVSGLTFQYRDTPAVRNLSITQLFNCYSYKTDAHTV